MKKLFLMRHAKSDWSHSSLDDFDRPLNKRGKKDAPEIGRFLFKHGILPEIIISSPAKRAMSTADFVADELKRKVVLDNVLYPGIFKNYLKKIKKIDNKYNIAMIIGHNPGIEDTIIKLISSHVNIKVPTGTIAIIAFPVMNWIDIVPGNNILLGYFTPKLIS